VRSAHFLRFAAAVQSYEGQVGGLVGGAVEDGERVSTVNAVIETVSVTNSLMENVVPPPTMSMVSGETKECAAVNGYCLNSFPSSTPQQTPTPSLSLGFANTSNIKPDILSPPPLVSPAYSPLELPLNEPKDESMEDALISDDTFLKENDTLLRVPKPTTPLGCSNLDPSIPAFVPSFYQNKTMNATAVLPSPPVTDFIDRTPNVSPLPNASGYLFPSLSRSTTPPTPTSSLKTAVVTGAAVVPPVSATQSLMSGVDPAMLDQYFSSGNVRLPFNNRKPVPFGVGSSVAADIEEPAAMDFAWSAHNAHPLNHPSVTYGPSQHQKHQNQNIHHHYAQHSTYQDYHPHTLHAPMHTIQQHQNQKRVRTNSNNGSSNNNTVNTHNQPNYANKKHQPLPNQYQQYRQPHYLRQQQQQYYSQYNLKSNNNNNNLMYRLQQQQNVHQQHQMQQYFIDQQEQKQQPHGVNPINFDRYPQQQQQQLSVYEMEMYHRWVAQQEQQQQQQ
jgi:hypothetical protein